MKTIFLFIAATFFTLQTIAQWTKINAIPTQHIVSLDVLGDTLLAATDANIIYKSSDGGITWNTITISVNPVSITKLKVIDNIIYAGTASNGIYISPDSGVTWINSSISPFAVSAIEKFGNNLYATTLGNGVYKFDQASGNWNAFNNALPSYSVNVFTIGITSNSILIGAGSNGTFYRYDFNGNAWNEEYYDGILHPGLQIRKLISSSDTVFAVNGSRVIRSENDGLTWVNDAIGVHAGLDGSIFSGINDYYTISNSPAGTWIQQRSKSAVSGTPWDVGEEFVPAGFGYDILEYHNTLFMGRGDGLYTKSLAQGISDPTKNDNRLKVFPNPSDGRTIYISSADAVNEYTIVNPLGQLLADVLVNACEFSIHPDLAIGIYFIKLTLLNGQVISRKIIVD